LKNLDDANLELNVKLSQSLNQKKELEEVKENLIKHKDEFNLINEKLSLKEEEIIVYLKEIEEKSITIDSLEAKVGEKLQIIISKEIHIDDLKRNFFKQSEIVEEKYNKIIFELNMKLDEYIEKIKNLENKEKEYLVTLTSEKNSQNDDRLEYIKNNLKELVIKLKTDLLDHEYNIDKRIISNILIKYFEKSGNDKLKLALLDTLASIMGFNNDERKKLGLNVISNGLTRRNDEPQSLEVVEIINEMNNIIEKI
jgi:hypothetical protein